VAGTGCITASSPLRLSFAKAKGKRAASVTYRLNGKVLRPTKRRGGTAVASPSALKAGVRVLKVRVAPKGGKARTITLKLRLPRPSQTSGTAGTRGPADAGPRVVLPAPSVVVGVRRARRAQDVLVEQGGDHRADHGSDEVDPQVAQLAADDGGRDRPGRIERGARTPGSSQVAGGDRQADRHAGRRALRAVVPPAVPFTTSIRMKPRITSAGRRRRRPRPPAASR
jgi:hypothetical protein